MKVAPAMDIDYQSYFDFKHPTELHPTEVFHTTFYELVEEAIDSPEEDVLNHGHFHNYSQRVYPKFRI